VEHVYHLANGSQKRSMLVEMYSTELQLFKDLTTTNSGRYLNLQLFAVLSIFSVISLV
jgi:pumilio homology domain family member 6